MPRDQAINLGLQLAWKLGCLQRDPQLQMLARLYKSGLLRAQDLDLVKLKLRAVHAYAARHPEHVTFNMPGPDTTGDLVLGSIGVPVQFPLEALSHHAVICAATGSGKTFFLLHLVRSILTSTPDVRVWCHDYVKNDYIAFITTDLGFGLLTSKNLFVNILEPPSEVRPEVYAERILEILASTLALPLPTLFATRRVLHPLYRNGHVPTLADLANAMRAAEDVNEAIKTNLLSKLDSIAAAAPSMYTTRHGIPIAELEQHNIVFDLHDLGAEVQNLIVAWSRAAAFCRRIEARVHSSRPTLVVVDDEAWRHFGSKHDGSYLCQLASTARSTGMSLVLANQTTDMSRNVVANAGTKILGVVGHGRDLDAMASAMNLNVAQRRWALANLRTARFIAKLSHGRYRDAFPFTACRVRAPRLPNARAMESAAQLTLKLMPPQEESTIATIPAREDVATPVLVSSDGLLLLRTVNEHPFQFLTHHYRACGLGNRRGTEAKKELVEKALVREHTIELGRTGRAPRLLEILDAGYKSLGVEPATRGDFLVEFSRAHLIASLQRDGYEIERATNRDVDVLARRTDELLGVIICTDPRSLSARLNGVEGIHVTRGEVHCLATPTLRQAQETIQNRPLWTARAIPLVPIGGQQLPLEPLDSRSPQ